MVRENRVVAISHAAKRLEAVIWDFNGTLIDDVDLVVRSVNVQLAKRGLTLLTIERYRDVFGFPVADYNRKVGLDPKAESMEALASEFHDEYVPGLPDCPLYDGVVDALERFKEKGARQFVLSAMEEELLRSTIERLRIHDYFEGVYGLEHFEGDSKLARAQELLRDFAIRPETALLIGDTDHDAEVAQALGLSVVLIAQGHQKKERLDKTGCPVYGSVRALAGDTSLEEGWESAKARREQDRHT